MVSLSSCKLNAPWPPGSSSVRLLDMILILRTSERRRSAG